MRVLALSGMGEVAFPVWVKSFDIEAHDGQGDVEVTQVRGEAYCWPNPAAAMAAWNTISTVRPVRADGKPNKPMTAMTIELEEQTP
jgi:hypothetical protein